MARAAEAAGIPTVVRFFGRGLASQLAADGQRADLLVGNNVLAHVPDLNDFVAGLAILLAPAGVLTMEFPHLLRLMAEDQFDTIYHEHYSYFSFTAACRVFAAHGLAIFDVEELPTHGGSLRVFVRHEEDSADGARTVTPAVEELLAREEAAGLASLEPYLRVRRARAARSSASCCASCSRPRRRGGRSSATARRPRGTRCSTTAACAPTSSTTRWTGARTSRAGICRARASPSTRRSSIRETRPDYVLILPWNLKDEIVAQMADVRSWGGRFVVAIPRGHRLRLT